MENHHLSDPSFAAFVNYWGDNVTVDPAVSTEPTVSDEYPIEFDLQMDSDHQIVSFDAPPGDGQTHVATHWSNPDISQRAPGPMNQISYYSEPRPQQQPSEQFQPAYPTQDHNSSVTQDELPKRDFGCPVYEADIILGRDHTCKGAREKNMSKIRVHMTRGRQPHLDFLSRCGTCEEDIIDRNEFQQSHGLRCNNPRKQLRGDAAQQQWNALYYKVNPAGTPLPTSSKCIKGDCHKTGY